MKHRFLAAGALAIAALLSGSALAADPSGDGIQVGQSFRASLEGTSAVIAVRFVFKNLSRQVLTFDSNGVFVGCRKGNVPCDFGHTARGQSLPARGSMEFTASMPCEVGARYEVWPAYHLNGHYGPYRWNSRTVDCRPRPR